MLIWKYVPLISKRLTFRQVHYILQDLFPYFMAWWLLPASLLIWYLYIFPGSSWLNSYFQGILKSISSHVNIPGGCAAWHANGKMGRGGIPRCRRSSYWSREGGKEGEDNSTFEEYLLYAVHINCSVAYFFVWNQYHTMVKWIKLSL